MIYRIRYHKLGRLRFISHLDIIQYFTRLVVRAQLPVAMTQGFNPRVKFEFGPALPMGFQSRAEYLHLYLQQEIPTEDILSRLLQCGCPGLAVEGVEASPAEKLSRCMNAYRYEVEITSMSPIVLDQIAAWDAESLQAAAGEEKLHVDECMLRQRGDNYLRLDWRTNIADGRLTDPRLLRKLLPEAEFTLECCKTDAYFRPQGA